MKRSIVALALIATVLLALCSYRPAFAQTSKKPHQQATIVDLKNSTWQLNYYYFAPSNVSCKIQTPCIKIVNQTGNWVEVTDNYGNYYWMYPGGTLSQQYMYIGTHYYTDTQQNINVSLSVHVHA